MANDAKANRQAGIDAAKSVRGGFESAGDSGTAAGGGSPGAAGTSGAAGASSDPGDAVAARKLREAEAALAKSATSFNATLGHLNTGLNAVVKAIQAASTR